MRHLKHDIAWDEAITFYPDETAKVGHFSSAGKIMPAPMAGPYKNEPIKNDSGTGSPQSASVGSSATSAASTSSATWISIVIAAVLITAGLTYLGYNFKHE